MAETSGWFTQTCYGSEAEKGGAMAGDGSSTTPYDCLLEGLLVMSAFAPGDLAVVKTGTGNYDLTFQGAYAHTDVEPVIIDDSALVGILPSATVTTTTAGNATTNEVQHVLLRNIVGATGRFRVIWNPVSTASYTEVSLAMNWIGSILAASPLATEVSGRIYQSRIPTLTAALKPPHAVVYTHNSNRDVQEVAGRTLFNSVLLDVAIVAPEQEPSAKTHRLAGDLDALFGCRGAEACSDGTILSSVRYQQVWVQEDDDNGIPWTWLGLTIEVSVQRGA